MSGAVRAPVPQLFPVLNTPKFSDSYVTMFYYCYYHTHYLPINIRNKPNENCVYRSKKRMFEKACVVFSQKIKKALLVIGQTTQSISISFIQLTKLGSL